MKNIVYIFFCLLLGCQDSTIYPTEGYNYPDVVAPGDSNLYHYQLKELSSQYDKLGRNYDYLFYKAFDEENLSIKAQLKETYRFEYSTAFGESMIITITDDFATIKKGNPSVAYADTLNLSSIEKYHLYLLRKYYPIDTTNKTQLHFKQIDSLVKLYPELLSSDYYNNIVDKMIMPSEKKFNYEMTRLPITKEQFVDFVKEVNDLGFWNLTYKIDCDKLVSATDGAGYSLEVNTKKKYKYVVANLCTGNSKNFAKICQKIIELAKIEKEVTIFRNPQPQK